MLEKKVENLEQLIIELEDRHKQAEEAMQKSIEDKLVETKRIDEKNAELIKVTRDLQEERKSLHNQLEKLRVLIDATDKDYKARKKDLDMLVMNMQNFDKEDKRRRDVSKQAMLEEENAIKLRKGELLELEKRIELKKTSFDDTKQSNQKGLDLVAEERAKLEAEKQAIAEEYIELSNIKDKLKEDKAEYSRKHKELVKDQEEINANIAKYNDLVTKTEKRIKLSEKKEKENANIAKELDDYKVELEALESRLTQKEQRIQNLIEVHKINDKTN